MRMGGGGGRGDDDPRDKSCSTAGCAAPDTAASTASAKGFPDRNVVT